jgi:hypothetical protein
VVSYLLKGKVGPSLDALTVLNYRVSRIGVWLEKGELAKYNYGWYCAGVLIFSGG